MITVIGLGLAENDLTLKAVDAIGAADKVFIKTSQTPTYGFFKGRGITAERFDTLYDEAENFGDLNTKIIDRLIKEAADKNIVFCVNGSGCDDAAVKELSRKTEIKIIAGAGHADNGLFEYPDTSYSCYAAYDVADGSPFMPDKRHTVVIKEIDNKFLAGDLKLILLNVYGDNKKIKLINNVKMTDNSTYIALADLDRQKSYGYYTTAVIEGESFLEAGRYDFCDLISVMEGLLADDGCPWDRAQTHESIRINLIEEAYELIDAIDSGDLDNMIEETGDVMLQAVFHCMLGKVDGEYDYADALSCLCKKLIARHTHVFGANRAESPEEALKCWNTAKSVEKEYSSISDKLEKIPQNLPALLYAYKIQKAAVKCGFDWRDIEGTFDKLQEEIREFKEASDDKAVMEAGDLLFSAVNPMRWRHIEPELALKAACGKFIKRFKYMESEIQKNGEDITLFEVREKYWAEAKKLFE